MKKAPDPRVAQFALETALADRQKLYDRRTGLHNAHLRAEQAVATFRAQMQHEKPSIESRIAALERELVSGDTSLADRLDAAVGLAGVLAGARELLRMWPARERALTTKLLALEQTASSAKQQLDALDAQIADADAVVENSRQEFERAQAEDARPKTS